MAFGHDPFGKLSRRHRMRRIAQHVVDQAQAFAGAEPAVARSLLPGPDLLGATVGIKQEHRRVNMGETGSMSEKLTLQPTHNPG
jgi:hypothetical protein